MPVLGRKPGSPSSSSLAVPRRRKIPWRRRAIVALLAVLSLLVAGLTLARLAAHWPDVAALAHRPPSTTAFIEAYRVEAQSEGLPPPDWRWVPYEQISPAMKRAVVVAEDLSFFSHSGFDFREIRAALFDTVQEGKRLRGASTITQQLAKNLWLSPSRSPWRKIEEAILVVRLERHLSKRRILELYLNVVELGPGLYGVEAAAQRYFHHPASALDDDEAAELAACLPRPSSWRPGIESRAYRRHVDRIRMRMSRADWLRKLV